MRPSQGTAEKPDVRTVRLPDIKCKLFSRNAVAKDRANNSVAPGDAVTLEDTRLRGRAGTVKYIHMGALFLHARCAPAHPRPPVAPAAAQRFFDVECKDLGLSMSSGLGPSTHARLHVLLKGCT